MDLHQSIQQKFGAAAARYSSSPVHHTQVPRCTTLCDAAGVRTPNEPPALDDPESEPVKLPLPDPPALEDPESEPKALPEPPALEDPPAEACRGRLPPGLARAGGPGRRASVAAHGPVAAATTTSATSSREKVLPGR